MSTAEGLHEWPEPEHESFFDGDLVAFMVSLVVHLALLIGLGLAPMLFAEPDSQVTIVTPPPEDPVEEKELILPEEFHMNERPIPEIGANSVADAQMALSSAEILSEMSDVPSPVDIRPVEIAPVETNQVIEQATALHIDNLPVRGAAGEGTTGAVGAIDRITQDILLSLEERPTLVVWMFDQSASLLRQRKQIVERLDRIYEELGVIEAAGNPAFKAHKSKPLLTAVMSFGQGVNFMVKKPTDNLAEIKEAVANVTLDESGVERVFSAVTMGVNRYGKYRRESPGRNVMMVVFTDEAGEDQNQLDNTVNICRRFEIPVYVVGIPAPFGRRETNVKWVDPDPKYDQSPQWGVVDQGPESLLPERVQLAFFTGEQLDPIDSGFGPFALTRLAYETGGIYFTVHPNRNVNRRVGRVETAAFSAHLKHFFDPEVMRPYRPDYVSAKEYMRRVKSNKAREALLAASERSWIAQMQTPRLRFLKKSEAELASALTEAQKAAAKLEPQLSAMYQLLLVGEKDRQQEISLRWQVGYDLAMGRVMAAKVRTEAYNAMLAQAKRGLKFKNAKNNTWVLTPSDDISVGSKLAKAGDKAREYLQEVATEHSGTPWALLAERELKTPLGWKWTEHFTDLSPPRTARRPGNNNNNRPRPGRRDEKAKMIAKPRPKRPPPKL